MVGERQGNSRGNGMGTAWERHGLCESALIAEAVVGAKVIAVVWGAGENNITAS
jgi:hypothetical protein